MLEYPLPLVHARYDLLIVCHCSLETKPGRIIPRVSVSVEVMYDLSEVRQMSVIKVHEDL